MEKIDLEELKKWCAGIVLYYDDSNPFVSQLDQLILAIKALEEAKEIIDKYHNGYEVNDASLWLAKWFNET